MEIMQQKCHIQGGGQTCKKRDRKLPGVWSTGRWVQNESAMRGMILSMHHGYVQVQFGGEVKKCRRQQLTLLPDGPSRKRATQDRLGGTMGGQRWDQEDSGTSSGDADSGASPVSPGSPASADAAGAYGSLGAVEQCC